MSHLSTIQSKFKASEFDVLTKAFKFFGWELKANAAARSYYKDLSTVYEQVAVNPDVYGYDIGLTFKDGLVHFTCDLFQSGKIEESLGPDFSKLKMRYAAEVIKDEYSGAYSYSERVENGNLVLEVMV